MKFLHDNYKLGIIIIFRNEIRLDYIKTFQNKKCGSLLLSRFPYLIWFALFIILRYLSISLSLVLATIVCLVLHTYTAIRYCVYKGLLIKGTEIHLQT